MIDRRTFSAFFFSLFGFDGKAEAQSVSPANQPYVKSFRQTTNATPVNAVSIPVPPGNSMWINANVIVSLTDNSKVTSFYVEGCAARQAVANVRMIATSFSRSGGEILPPDAKVQLLADTANQAITITITGKAATTYNWFIEYNLFGTA